MNNCSTFFNYNTLPEKLYDKYVPLSDCERVKVPYKSGARIFSGLSQNIELIQMLVFGVLNSIVFSLTSKPTLALILATPTIIFFGYKFYRIIFCIDPLREAFYKICGDKKKFLELPKITMRAFEDKLDSKDSVELLKAASSESSPIYRSWRSARNVLVVKGPKDKLFVFVEKLSPWDFKNISLFTKIIFIAKISLLPFINYSEKICIDNIEFAGNISTDMANEFFLQNRIRSVKDVI